MPFVMGIKATQQHLGPIPGPAADPDLLAEDAHSGGVVHVSEAQESHVVPQNLLGEESRALL